MLWISTCQAKILAATRQRILLMHRRPGRKRKPLLVPDSLIIRLGRTGLLHILLLFICLTTLAINRLSMSMPAR
jgi:hypothetical protein